ncbi:MAG: hypothetical protein WDM89_10890 [Rhizomicrobium sp.]
MAKIFLAALHRLINWHAVDINLCIIRTAYSKDCVSCPMSGDVEKFYRIIGELDRLLLPGMGDGFWAARPIFAEMDRSFLNGWGICRVEEILEDKETSVFRDKDVLTINVTKGYAISLAIVDAPADNLYLYPQHYLARNVGHVPVKVRRYTCSGAIQNDVFDPTARLELRDELTLQPGDCVERNGHTDVLEWESTGATGYVLRLHSSSLGNYEWAFDRLTLTPKGVTVLDALSSQMTTAMQMLTTLAIPVDKDFIESGLASPYFHVRWETLKMINRLAPEMALETVERLAHDPHPAIRRLRKRLCH